MKNVIQFVAVFFVVPFLSFSQTWTQVGGDMDGEVIYDESGYAVSMSSDGSTVAIGAHFNDGAGNSAGHIRVYKKVLGVWTQLGSDIDGEAAGDYSGTSVSISSDGLTVAIGATYNDGTSDQSGHVRVYQYISGVWTQLGSDIDGEAGYDYSGTSVSISSDGLTVAIGAPENDGAGSKAGHVRVYQYISGGWSQLGADIDGEAANDKSGNSVSLSSDGNTVAIGAKYADGTFINSGHVRVYRYLLGAWTQLGADIDGKALNEYSSSSLSISSDGMTVVIGATKGSQTGLARVYQYNSGSWTQLGLDINGKVAGENSGISVSVSSDGLTVAIGGNGTHLTSTDGGNVRVYKYVSAVWTQLGTDIDGEAAEDASGNAVSISSDGMTVAVGARGNDGTASQAGNVRVYQLITPTDISQKTFQNISAYPNPNTGIVNVDIGEFQDVSIKVYAGNGQLVYSKFNINSSSHQFELKGQSGLYFIYVTTDNVTQVLKAVVVK